MLIIAGMQISLAMGNKISRGKCEFRVTHLPGEGRIYPGKRGPKRGSHMRPRAR